VLRYDKRGVGGSGGVYRGATTADFATDAAAAVRFVMAYPDIDPLRVGVLGHSEGGVIAPMVAASDPEVAFIVMMAGPAIRGDKLFVAQSAKVARLYGAPEAYVAGRQALDRELYAAVIAAPTAEAARAEAKAIIVRGVESKLVDAGEVDSLAKSITSPWQRYFLAHGPRAGPARLKVPVLAVYGGLDAQAPAADNASIAREALKDVQGATVVEMPGHNHLLQRAETGSPQRNTPTSTRPCRPMRLSSWPAGSWIASEQEMRQRPDSNAAGPRRQRARNGEMALSVAKNGRKRQVSGATPRSVSGAVWRRV